MVRFGSWKCHLIMITQPANAQSCHTFPAGGCDGQAAEHRVVCTQNSCSLVQLSSCSETPLYLSWPASQLIRKESGCLAGLFVLERWLERLWQDCPISFFFSGFRYFPISQELGAGLPQCFYQHPFSLDISAPDKGQMSLKILLDTSSSPWHHVSKSTVGPVRGGSCSPDDLIFLHWEMLENILPFASLPKCPFFWAPFSSLLFHMACEHLWGLKARHFIPQFHYHNVTGTSIQYLISRRPQNSFAGLLWSVCVVLGL